MNAVACEGVEIGRESCNKSFALTCFHFRNTSLMEDYSAYELDAVWPQTYDSVCCFTDSGKSLRKNIVKCLTLFEPCLEFVCFFAELLVRQLFIVVREGFNFISDGVQLFKLPITVSSKNFLNKSHLKVPFVNVNQ